MSFFYQNENMNSNKTYGFGVAVGAGLLALAGGLIALSRLTKEDTDEQKLKKAAKKVKREVKKAEEVMDDIRTKKQP